jgi:DNA-binding transcriptional LysR family regulator
MSMSRQGPTLAGINTNLVIALHALLEEQHVSKAAKAAGLGQSSMSYALARLRTHFDDPLLVQEGKRMVPTRLARSLVGPVRQAVALLEAVFTGASGFDPATSRQTFHIASTDNLELLVLPRLSRLLRTEAPGIDIRVFPLLEDWREALRGGELDLKLGRSYDPGPGLVGEDLLDERFVAVLRDGHPIKARRLSLTQYAGLLHVRIATSPGMQDTTSDLIDAQLAAQGLSRRVALTVPHFLVAPFVVASSDLVLTAPQRLIDAFRTSLRLRTATPALLRTEYRLSQVWSAHRTDDPTLVWLRGAVRRCLAQA